MITIFIIIYVVSVISCLVYCYIYEIDKYATLSDYMIKRYGYISFIPLFNTILILSVIFEFLGQIRIK